MKSCSRLMVTQAAILCCLCAAAQQMPPTSPPAVPPQVQIADPPESNAYPLTPDSLPDPTVPHGQSFQLQLSTSKIYPETSRTITVYVPAEYKAGTPACVYVGLDGLGFHVATVFDNLIAHHQMPVTIAIGIAPGEVPPAAGEADPRYDRSFEFDSRSDRLTRFILEEVFPAVEAHPASRDPSGSGKIVLSTDPNDRSIGGASTGGIGAFTVAWEHPEAFRRVFSAIGTYVGMRGGENYYVTVRKTEPKPIRIYLQDGVHDEWPGGPEMGDWWMSNQTMERALKFAGYDVEHTWGAGTHNGSHADALFPDAMRWLWRDYPASIGAGISGNPVLKSILKPGEDWQQIADCPAAAEITTNPSGTLVYWSSRGLHKLNLGPTDEKGSCDKRPAPKSLVAFDATGKPFRADRSTRTIVAGPDRKGIANRVEVNGFIVRNNGDLYYTTGKANGEVRLIRAGRKLKVASGVKSPSGLAISRDGLWLFVAQKNSRSSFSYRIHPDGSLDAGIPFYDLYVPTWADGSGATSVWTDTNGLAYVATTAGVQVMDRNGRVAAILPLPAGAPADSLCFGGDGFHTLYVSVSGKVYARKLNATGAPAWAPPAPLPKWGAG